MKFEVITQAQRISNFILLVFSILLPNIAFSFFELIRTNILKELLLVSFG